jgi:tRNA modification GTPase
VSPIPGTTRDTIEETANIRGIPVVFTDTAGLRESTDDLELEGIRRSMRSMENADFVIHLLDASEPLTQPDLEHLGGFKSTKCLLVLNKCDLPAKLVLPPEFTAAIRVSCISGEGIEHLKDAVRNLAWSGEVRVEMLEVMINARHKNALERARECLVRAREGMANSAPLDIVAIDLKQAVDAVGEVVGKTSTEDLLDVIFSQFCIGK